jgi:hypothetical protein
MTGSTEFFALTSHQDTGTREAVTRAAERFLADTVEAINPDTPAPALLRYAAGYRAHLVAVIEANTAPPGSHAWRDETL